MCEFVILSPQSDCTRSDKPDWDDTDEGVFCLKTQRVDGVDIEMTIGLKC